MKFLTQAAKALQEKKRYQHRLAIFLCLAVVVTLGTFAALKLSGQAMTHQRKVLNCQLEIHRHSEECYDKEEEGKLICGQADYVVHKHNDDCYNLDSGELVCRISELEVHKHDDNCYQEEKVLVCKEEEKDAHTHIPECYIREKGDLQCVLEEHAHVETCYIRENTGLQCGFEEHIHVDRCYDETGVLTCQQEEHQHSDDCYAWTETLNCSLEEHQHNDDCYTWTETLACQQEEMQDGHMHTDECYETKKTLVCEKEEVELHTHDENCQDETGVLICNKLQVEEHIHGAECFETVELNDEEVAALNTPEPEEEPAGDNSASSNFASEDSASKNSASKNSASGNSTSDNSASGNSASDNETGHVHDESCYDSAGGLMCGFEGETPDITKVCETEDYIVTAVYKESANIPEEAELLAELITADKDEAHYAKREAEIKEALKDENVSMNALFKIGFYVDGKEVEPESDVSITVQFLDENGLAEGSPIAIIHFADGGNQVLNGGKAKNKSTTFKTKSFSEFGIVEGFEVPEETAETAEDEAEEKKDAENDIRSVSINEEYDFQTEKFAMRFTFSGKATVAAQKETEEKKEEKNISVNSLQEIESANEEGGDGIEKSDDVSAELEGENTEEANASEGEEDSTDAASNPEGDSEDFLEEDNGSDEITETETDTTLPEESDVAEDEPSGAEKPTITGEPINPDSDGSQKFEFTANLLKEDSEEYKIGAAHAEETARGEIFALEAVTYNLKYEGEELDLSDCNVTIEIVPTSTFSSYMASVAAEEIEETGIKADESEIVNIAVVELDESQQQKEITSELHGKNQMVKFRSTSSTFVTYGSKTANPKYKVQYYATLERIDKQGPVAGNPKAGTAINSTNYSDLFTNKYQGSIKKNLLPFISTAGAGNGGGGVLPQNGKVPNTITLPIVDGKVKTKSEDTKVYETKEFDYILAPTLKYVNVLADNPGYDLKEIWVQEDGKAPDSTQKADWVVYEKKDSSFNYIHFTNRQETVEEQKKLNPNDTFILIQDEKTVIRMLYTVTKNKRNSPAVFYDYDIGDGNNKTSGTVMTMNTKASGINSPANCGNEYKDSKYAFGNFNTGTDFGLNIWDGSLLNATNRGVPLGTDEKTGSYGYAGCTFGLAKNPDGEGLVFNAPAPKVFGTDTQTGKYRMVGEQDQKFSLDFARKGDTYTLTAVKGTGAKNLDIFEHPQAGSRAPYAHILTNNFWPMDGEQNGDIHFGESGQQSNQKGSSGDLPESDDGKNHNSYFGMYYTVDFDLDKSYVGPLEYLFYGDDDMWVFLDNTLVCDIGGVHSSVGEYVNLWDWIKRDKLCDHTAPNCRDGNGDIICKKNVHKLSFYYTERGASGSSCWMQFTLPSITTMTPETTGKDYGKLKIQKTVTVNNPGANFDEDQDTFKFKIRLENAKDDYAYIKYDADGNVVERDLVIWNGGSFTLKNGEYIIIDNLPVNTKYTIIEENKAASQYDEDGETGTVTEIMSEYEYFTDVTVNGELQGGGLTDNKQATGTIKPVSSGAMDKVVYINQYRVYELPETGGTGVIPYTIASIFCIVAGAVLAYRKRIITKRA